MLRFTIVLLGVISSLWGLVYVLASQGIQTPSYYIETTLLLGLSVWVAFKKLIVIQSPSTFAQAYLTSVVLQLLGWLSYLGVVLYLDKSGAKANAVYFLVNSLIFIGLEVVFLYPRKQS